MAGQAQAIHSLEMQADLALFSGAVDGLVCLFYQNERPLHGLSGVLDWRFHGMISRNVRQGAIQGKSGECVYLPVSRHGRVFHLILVGAGNSESPAARARPSAVVLESIRKNLTALRIPKIGISRRDFGGPADSFIEQQLSPPRGSLWVTE